MTTDAAFVGLPEPALRPGPRGAVLRRMWTEGGELREARVELSSEPRVERLDPIEPDPVKLGRWLELLARRRGQLAHDLSGPATGVLAALETVLEFEPVPDSSRSLLGDARSGMLRLTRLLDARDGLLSPRVNALEGQLDELFESWVRAVAQTLDPGGERLITSIDAPSQHARVDSALLQGALWTLLKNSWKLRRGHRVEVRVEADATPWGLRLTVEDSGRGLDDEALRRAGDLGFTTRPSGVGLGLFTLRYALRDRGAVRLERLADGCRAEIFLFG